MITFNEFVNKYEGKTVGYPDDSSFKGECLSLTKWHIKEVYGINPPTSGCNAARCYWSVFPNPLGAVLKKVSLTGGLIPKRGWIAVWNSNAGSGYGHIASVLEADTNSFTSLDQNWNGRHAHRVKHDYTNIYGFLVPLKEEEDMAVLHTYLGVSNDDEAKIRLKDHLGEKDGKCDWGSDEGDRGGYLGSERRKNKTLNTKLNIEIQEHKKTAMALDEARSEIAKLNDELENAGLAVDLDLWDMNGLTIEITENNTKTITNYKLKN